MLKRILLVLLLAAACVVAGYHVYGRYFTPERERVQRVIGRLITHLESDNVLVSVPRIRGLLSDKYRHRGEGTEMAIDKVLAIQYLMGLKQRYSGFEVEVQGLTVTVLGNSATVDIIGRVTAKRSSRRIELLTDGGHNRARIELEKEDGDWIVVSSRRLAHHLND